MSNSTRCAACKSLRRRCAQDCVLAPYFPSNNPQRFGCVHKIFGASNISRMLQQLPVEKRAAAADSMSFEASYRVQEPVYGCVGIIDQLQQQITMVQHEVAKTRGEIAFYSAQQARQQQQQMSSRTQVEQGGGGGEEAALLNATAAGQQEPFQLLDQQVFPDYYQVNHQM